MKVWLLCNVLLSNFSGRVFAVACFLQSIAFTLSIAISMKTPAHHYMNHVSDSSAPRDSCVITQAVPMSTQESSHATQNSILRYFTFPCCLTYLGRTRRHASCLRSCRADSFFPWTTTSIRTHCMISFSGGQLGPPGTPKTLIPTG